MMTEPLPVFLYDVHLGEITSRGPGRVGFRTSGEAIKAFGLGSRVLSLNLPLSAEPSNEDAATAFFGGILPEGRGRDNLARQTGLAKDDLFGMLAYAGKDVPGAVVIGSLPVANQGLHAPVDAQDIESLLNRTSDYAMGSVGGGGSLPGIQPKAVLAWIDGWHTAAGGAMSTHILKPVAVGEEWVAHWEAYCLALARKIDLLQFDSCVETFGNRTALVVERYDRTTGPNDFERIHQEDAAQALGLPWDTDAKFESIDPRASYANIANLLPTVRKLRPERGYRHLLLAYLTFNVAIGNTDAHAKNFSLIHTPSGKVQLAPLYDVTALALAPDGQQNMAMRVNGHAYQPSLTVDDIVTEGVRWGLPQAGARELVLELLQALAAAVETTDPGQTDEIVGKYISIQVANLLNEKPAAVSSAPAYLRLF